MDRSGNAGNFEPFAIWSIMIFFAVAIPFCALDQPAGPTRELSGVVESVGALPNDFGRPVQLANVTLSTGVVVSAKVVIARRVNSGDVVRVREMRRIFSDSRTYEIY